MASTAPPPVEPNKTKLSFAKVAASACKPQHIKEIPSNARPQSVNPTPNQAPNANAHLTGVGLSQTVHMASTENGSPVKETGANDQTGQWTNSTGQQVAFDTRPKEGESDKPPPSITLVKSLATDDSATQLSSSEGSGKPPSLDGKSVASATTFALDEKESIRPDDSASLRAVEEEDVTTPPDSVAAGSRVGSDIGGVRAFRDQLHEIAVMGPLPQRGAPAGRFPVPNSSSPALFDPNQPPAPVPRPMSQPLVIGMPNPGSVPPVPAVPDDKLVEALDSPRDRLFVLKLEQDFIDFVKDSSEAELSLPNCNTFYRMLAHRLADYYLLGHVVDNTLTGVKITKTPYCRIPPPLSGLPISSKSASTPPVDLPARKIMRRGGDAKSGTNTTTTSEVPSMTTSEAGAASGSDTGNDISNDLDGKDKSSLTREEREARYREARQRIFGAAEGEENESLEAVATNEEDMSRSSSASGKKKSKKQRNYDDDGFEARSRFNVYYNQQYPTATYSGDGTTMYYGGYSGTMPGQAYPNMSATMSPPPTYGNGYQPIASPDMQSQYGWAGQPYQTPNGPMPYPSYSGAVSNGYDLTGDFQRGMQSFQSAGMQTQATPKMTSPPTAMYPDSYQQQNMAISQGWSMMNPQQPYAMAQSTFAQHSQVNRPVSAPVQGPGPGPYPYGQFPSPGFVPGKPNRNQHPLPGSFNRQQFNPQSQTFIPGGRNPPFQMQQSMTQMGAPQNMSMGINAYGNYQMPMSTPIPGQMQSQMQSQMARISPPVSHPHPQQQSFGSPHISHSNITPPKPASQHQTNLQSSSQQPQAAHANPNASSSSTSQMSSIAKWGTPSHLPPKPPPPAQPQPKFPPLPSHGFANASRVTANVGSGFAGGGSNGQ